MFQVPSTMSDKIIKVNPRAERHGNEEVPAVDLRLEIILPNYVLNEFARELLGAMYSSEEARLQKPLDGIQPLSDYPHLRFPNLQPLRLQDEYIGYKLQIDGGAISTDNNAGLYIHMEACALSRFVVECKEGGYVVMRLNVSRSDIDEVTLGRLGVLTGCDIKFRLYAPEFTGEDEDSEEQEQAAEET